MTAVLLRAAAAVSHGERIRAVEGLREQLRVMAVAAGVTVDWSTLTVTGPTEAAGADVGARIEWCASVVAHAPDVTSRSG